MMIPFCLVSVFMYLTVIIHSLNQVLELRPSIKWDKGKALEFLLNSLGVIFLSFLKFGLS